MTLLIGGLILSGLKAAFSFVFGVIWKVILKLTPLVIHEIVIGLGFLLKFVKAEMNDPAVANERTIIRNDVELYVKGTWAKLDAKEKVAFVVAPIILILLIVGIIYFHG